MKLLAVLAGKSRMSIFGERTDDHGPGPAQVILAVDDTDQAVSYLEERGIRMSGPPAAAGTLLRFVTTTDPDGNTIACSEYLRSPRVAI